jgi:hypothetical protein
MNSSIRRRREGYTYDPVFLLESLIDHEQIDLVFHHYWVVVLVRFLHHWPARQVSSFLKALYDLVMVIFWPWSFVYLIDSILLMDYFSNFQYVLFHDCVSGMFLVKFCCVEHLLHAHLYLVVFDVIEMMSDFLLVVVHQETNLLDDG